MKKKLIVILIVSLAVILFVALMAVPAIAKDKPKHADGIWYYTPDFANLYMHQFDPYAGDPSTLYAAIPYSSTWTGTFEGTSWDYGLVIFHGPDPMLFVDAVSFTGEVCGVSGTVEMDVLGDRPDTSAEWRGTWVITGGTGELADLQGHGRFWGPGYLGGEDPGVIYYKIEKKLTGIDCHDNIMIIRE